MTALLFITVCAAISMQAVSAETCIEMWLQIYKFVADTFDGRVCELSSCPHHANTDKSMCNHKGKTTRCKADVKAHLHEHGFLLQKKAPC